MLKNIVKFLFIIQLLIVAGFAADIFLEDKTNALVNSATAGLATKTVHAIDEEGNVQGGLAFGRMINVDEDNMVITGTAGSNCMIDISKDVKTVTFENLQRNGHDIQLFTDENMDLEIIFRGSNELYDIYCDGDLVLTGSDKNAEITLTDSIFVNGVLNISNGTVTAPQIYSDDDMIIEGDTKIYLKKLGNEDDMFIYARMESYGDIILDLSGEGIVEIEGDPDEGFYTTSAAGFEFGENTKIVTPEGGYAGLVDPEFEDEYCIMTKTGEDTERVVIKAVKSN